MAKVALDLEDVFLVIPVLLNDVDICTCCKEVVIATFLATLASKTFLVLVFLACLALVGRKLLVLATRYISKSSINGLNSSRVFLLLFCRPVSSGTT